MDSTKSTAMNRDAETAESREIAVYQRPAIRVLDEKEVLSAFQVTVAAVTWWVM